MEKNQPRYIEYVSVGGIRVIWDTHTRTTKVEKGNGQIETTDYLQIINSLINIINKDAHPIATSLCKTLTNAWDIDPDAVQALLCCRVPTNGALATHPTIQIVEPLPGNHLHTLSLLGLINGACEDGYAVALIWSGPEDVDQYGRQYIKGLCVVDQNFEG